MEQRVKSFGALPLKFIYGTDSGSLLGDSDSPEDLENDRQAMREAWARTARRSSNNLGLHPIEGANHISIVAYQQYGEQVARVIRETIAASPDPFSPGD